MRIFLHDEDCNPLGIVSLDWDVEKRGTTVEIPVWGRMSAATYSGQEMANVAQGMGNKISIFYFTYHAGIGEGRPA
jgi:hypothetical protein